MSVRITCVSKANGNHESHHCSISKLGWINEDTENRGSSTRLEMYDWIKVKGGRAYVTDNQGNKVQVGTAETSHGTKYVRTYRDKVWTDNLLALGEC